MSLLPQINGNAAFYRYLSAILLLLLINVSHVFTQHYYISIQQSQLIDAAIQQQELHLNQPLWITETAEQQISYLPQATEGVLYTSVSKGQSFYFIDNRLLHSLSAVAYIVLNLLLLLSLLPVYLFNRKQALMRNQRLALVTKGLEQLQHKLDIKQQSGDNAEQLAMISDRVTQLLKRDQEVRHLVRVQGLVDHELAIGNRVFFESKLQHYLSDLSEVTFGTVYIVQLSHPEGSGAGLKQISRLKGCVDILHGVASSYADTVVARLSDNDLVLLVAGVAAKDIEKLGDKLALLLSRASCFADCQDQDVVHIGYAAYHHGQTSYQILSEADMALKTAQLQGPNAAFGYVDRSDKPQQAKGSVWWRSELNKALQEHRFVLNFQPVFSWQDDDVLQHEVLVRLNSSNGEKISAAIFLPMAFNCGLACQIDQHVLLKSAKLCAADSSSSNRCSVNISIQSLLEPQWWQWLDHMTLSGQIDPQQFAFEISEHHLVKHYKQLRRQLLKLHQAGFAIIVDQVGLIIDNFISSEDLPVESVKLHASIVRNIDQHLEQQLFVRGLIAGYADRGIRVIATGVELEQEWLTLKKLGVAGGQGFYFSQPLAQIITHSQLQ